jgi:hypothetical protein
MIREPESDPARCAQDDAVAGPDVVVVEGGLEVAVVVERWSST